MVLQTAGTEGTGGVGFYEPSLIRSISACTIRSAVCDTISETVSRTTLSVIRANTREMISSMNSSVMTGATGRAAASAFAAERLANGLVVVVLGALGAAGTTGASNDTGATGATGAL